MCGIFGMVSAEPLKEPRNMLENLTDRLAHRGPDARGSTMSENVFLGHRRLAIIDRAGGVQPMFGCGNRYVIVYNGELYNFKHVRQTLKSLGHCFRTASDTEVILQAYIEWGAACLARFSGIFAFAIWDSQDKELFLVRDRLGVKPVYHAFIGQCFLFASEMKAIVAHPRFRREVNLSSLSSYLSLRTVLGGQTIFAGLTLLSPGTYLRWKDGVATVHQYWDVPIVPIKEDRGEEYYLTNASELLSRAVAGQLVSDVPVGAYLSGGLDSSVIVSLMSERHSGLAHTFSIGFDAQGYDESRYARMVSDHCGTKHKHLIMHLEDFVATMEKMVIHRDEPLSIPHEAALFQLSTEVKKDVTVCLSGEGADELFGGYGRVQRSPMDYKKLQFFKGLPSPIRAFVARLISDPDLLRRMELSDDLAHLLYVYNWWGFETKREFLSDEVQAALDGDSRLHTHLEDLFVKTRNCNVYDRVLYFFEKVHLPNLLVRLDIQSMAASVEARVPFVDHELVEFVSAIPIKYKLRWKSILHMLRAVFMKSENASERLDTSKYLLRKLAAVRLPAQIARRKKLGFPVPLDFWFSQSFGSLAREVLLDRRTRERGIFKADNIGRLISSSERIPFDHYGKRLWMLVNVELWFRAFIDRTPESESSRA